MISSKCDPVSVFAYLRGFTDQRGVEIRREREREDTKTHSKHIQLSKFYLKGEFNMFVIHAYHLDVSSDEDS